MLSILHHEFGLDKIERVIKLNGFVNADKILKNILMSLMAVQI